MPSRTVVPARLETLFSMFLAPRCWREDLSIRQSPKAAALRAWLTSLVGQRCTDGHIKAKSVKEYSKRILALPEGTASNAPFWAQWVAGALVVGRFIRSSARAGALPALLLLFAVGCARSPKPQQIDHYALKGVVLRLDEADKIAVVKHEKIANAEGKVWMDAMTMDFPVRDASEFQKLRPDAKVTARVNVDAATLNYWIDQVVVVAP